MAESTLPASLDSTLEPTTEVYDHFSESSLNGVTDDVTDDVGSGNSAVVVMRVILVLVGTVGAIDNGLALLIIYRVQSLKKHFGNLYMIHQCVVDLLCSISVVITYSVLLSVRKLNGHWGSVLCKAILSETFVWTTLSMSAFNLVCVNVDRYILIAHHARYSFWGQRKVKAAVIVAMWLFTFCTSLVVQIDTSGLVGHTCYGNIFWPSDVILRTWGYFVFATQWLVPMSLYVCMYTHIYFITRKTRMAVESSSSAESSVSGEASADSGKNRKMSKDEKEVVKTLVLVCVVFAVCSTPDNIYYLLYNVGYNISFTSNFYYFCVVLMMANCATNPFVYLAKMKGFRAGLKLILHRQN